MYQLENQVCTLEQAKKFNEAGLKLDSCFVWWRSESKEWYLGIWYSVIDAYFPDRMIYPAYSSAELDVLLPSRCEIDGYKYCFYNFRKKPELSFHTYAAGYYLYPDNPEVIAGIEYTGQNGAHAKSDLLLHLLKEKIVEPQYLSL